MPPAAFSALPPTAYTAAPAPPPTSQASPVPASATGGSSHPPLWPEHSTGVSPQVGAKVQKGQVICIIEAMTLMNEIQADQCGTITETLVENGKPVVSLTFTPLLTVPPASTTKPYTYLPRSRQKNPTNTKINQSIDTSLFPNSWN